MQDYTDWNAIEATQFAKKEIENLYAWWQERKTKDERTGKDEPDYLVDNVMLKRLIDVRMHLWT